jgi:rhodanese-related sulfurtransferase
MIQEISVRDLADKLKAGTPIYLIDVRQTWEHETAALPESLLVPLNELSRRLQELRPPEGALVVTYCHHGVRSLNAAAFLERNGFERVFSLAGGIDAWSMEIDRDVPRY